MDGAAVSTWAVEPGPRGSHRRRRDGAGAGCAGAVFTRGRCEGSSIRAESDWKIAPLVDEVWVFVDSECFGHVTSRSKIEIATCLHPD